MKTAYIRHNFTSGNIVLRSLWKELLIAIRYENIPSINPDDYEGTGKNTLIRLLDFCNKGILIAATYSSLEPSKMLIGIVAPESKVKPYQIGKEWFKVVKLSKVKEVSFVDFPVLSALQPINGTLVEWPSARKIVTAVYLEKN